MKSIYIVVNVMTGDVFYLSGISQSEVDLVKEGVITIVNVEDMTFMDDNGRWENVSEWPSV